MVLVFASFVRINLILILIFHTPDFGMGGWTNTVQPWKFFYPQAERPPRNADFPLSLRAMGNEEGRN
jgi:hypothetical protein